MSEAAATALVTGGAKRIGRAIVEDLCAHGFAVAIHGHNSSPEAFELAAQINAQGGTAEVFDGDLTDMGEAGSLMERVAKALGPVRLLVNNASLFEDDSVLDFDWQGWDAHFSIHLKAPVLLARDMAEGLPAGADGLVVNIIDQRVWRLSPRYFSYTLSKSALWTATRTMAQALAPRIRVNAIGPGPTLRNARQDEADFRKQVDALLLQRGPELSEFGATIRYLWQVRSVTGQMIALDGGQHLAWQTPDIAGVVE
ncbi:SDR family oxidoreductase [Aquamicrobium terrae]|uniref:NAD(P)-dependent dehydrogenase (Short-subunit alcohol dehydrogenase family) n=1 Tax=Aquamicrobium terrae TaxID=1324945 RepID=A0ABV2N0Q7_9HYPH